MALIYSQYKCRNKRDLKKKFNNQMKSKDLSRFLDQQGLSMKY